MPGYGEGGLGKGQKSDKIILWCPIAKVRKQHTEVGAINIRKLMPSTYASCCRQHTQVDAINIRKLLPSTYASCFGEDIASWQIAENEAGGYRRACLFRPAFGARPSTAAGTGHLPALLSLPATPPAVCPTVHKGHPKSFVSYYFRGAVRGPIVRPPVRQACNGPPSCLQRWGCMYNLKLPNFLR